MEAAAHGFIKISNLRILFEESFRHIVPTDAQGFNLLKDYYWSDTRSESKLFGIGSLYDDYEFIEDIAYEREGLGADLMHLAPILSYMATEVDWNSDEHVVPQPKSRFIKIHDLKIIFDETLKWIEKEIGVDGGFNLIKNDYYYPDDRYKILERDPEIIKRQLMQDWEALDRVLSGKESASPSTLVQLAAILEYMAYEVNWYCESHTKPRIFH